ncbi:hypothetical protein GWI33_009418 [Rhynchophorus ferrugineus]|uniref:Uncharacterized protein n=1 Tax=Rhynchophorus ferrugineus TaxID=354439 RepID=A0A834I9T8_RHYFE|nr:hypothetical protein GWI33_009418 [Rhynchophorus ferrugineus]
MIKLLNQTREASKWPGRERERTGRIRRLARIYEILNGLLRLLSSGSSAATAATARLRWWSVKNAAHQSLVRVRR